MLYGAFIGDMVGVPYEFLPCDTRDFKMFSEYTRYSDDSVMTMAIAAVMLETKGFSEERSLPCRNTAENTQVRVTVPPLVVGYICQIRSPIILGGTEVL